MINSFKNYLVEEDKVAYFTFGRMNPPTVGHEKLMDSLAKKAGRNPYFVFVSQSQDANKNPLSYNVKVKHIRKMFPKHARRVLINKKIRTFFEAATMLYDQGFKSLVAVVGSDRVREFETLLNRYNGVKGQHGFYNFKSISVASAGARDPDAEGVEGMSASKLRSFAANNDFTSFAQGLGKMNNKDAKKLFVDVRNGMGIKEETVFKRHIELEPVSETREKFVKGELFEAGDQVVIKESDEVGTISYIGSNYVIVELGEDRVVRKWLDAIEKLEEDDSTKVKQDPDIKDRKGSQPAKYHKGLSKAMKQRRDAQFKRQTKMSDKDPKAYKPAPGDKTTKTKPSKYTKQYNKMFGKD